MSWLRREYFLEHIRFPSQKRKRKREGNVSTTRSRKEGDFDGVYNEPFISSIPLSHPVSKCAFKDGRQFRLVVVEKATVDEISPCFDPNIAYSGHGKA